MATATPTPTGGVTPTPTPVGSVTPTPTGSHTDAARRRHAYPTQGGSPTPVPTALPSFLTQGDFNCDGSLTAADGVVVLVVVSGGQPQQTAPCQPIGANVGSNKFGEPNVTVSWTRMDAVLTIKKAAGLTVTHTKRPGLRGVPDS